MALVPQQGPDDGQCPSADKKAGGGWTSRFSGFLRHIRSQPPPEPAQLSTFGTAESLTRQAVCESAVESADLASTVGKGCSDITVHSLKTSQDLVSSTSQHPVSSSAFSHILSSNDKSTWSPKHCIHTKSLPYHVPHDVLETQFCGSVYSKYILSDNESSPYFCNHIHGSPFSSSIFPPSFSSACLEAHVCKHRKYCRCVESRCPGYTHLHRWASYPGAPVGFAQPGYEYQHKIDSPDKSFFPNIFKIQDSNVYHRKDAAHTSPESSILGAHFDTPSDSGEVTVKTKGTDKHIKIYQSFSKKWHQLLFKWSEPVYEQKSSLKSEVRDSASTENVSGSVEGEDIEVSLLSGHKLKINTVDVSEKKDDFTNEIRSDLEFASDSNDTPKSCPDSQQSSEEYLSGKQTLLSQDISGDKSIASTSKENLKAKSGEISASSCPLSQPLNSGVLSTGGSSLDQILYGGSGTDVDVKRSESSLLPFESKYESKQEKINISANLTNLNEESNFYAGTEADFKDEKKNIHQAKSYIICSKFDEGSVTIGSVSEENYMNTSKDSNKRNVSIDERANRVGSDSADYDSCHILKDDKESRDETGGVTVRRGSIASTASEGRGTQRVKRVFTSTLSQWKQFQGSLGSLTNSLRRHYHQKISRGQSLKEDGEEQVSNSREVTQSQADDKHSREVCLAEKSLELCVDLEPSVEWKSSFKYALDKTEECDIVSVPASQEERVNIISKTEESKKLNDSDMNNEKDECRHSVRTLSSVVVSLSSCAVAGEELTKSNSSGSSSSDGGDASIQSFLSVIPKVPERKNSSASREKSDIMEGTNLEEIASGKEPVMMDLSEPSSFDTIEEDFDPGMKKTSESQKGALVNTGKDNTVTPQFNGRGQQSRKNSKQSRSSDSMEDEPRPKRLNVDLDKDYTKSTPICHSTPLSVNVQLDILNTRRLFCEGMLGSETTLRSSTEDITGERKCLEDENSDMASALHENTLEPLHDHEIFQRGIIDSFNIESATSDKDSIEIELGTCDNENIAVIENVDSNDCTSKRIIMDAHDETIVDAPDLGNAAPAVSSKCDVEGGGGVEGENAQLMLVSAASDSPVSQKASSSYQRVCQDDESASGVQDTEEAHIQDTAEAHILDTEEAHIQDTDKECSSSLDLKDYEETVVNEINVEEFLSESEKEKARNTELKLLNFEKTDDTENEEILGIAEEDGISENILDFPTMAGPKIVVTGAVGSALNSGIPPTIVLESGSVGSGGGASMEEINIAAHADALPSSSLSNLAPTQFGGAHPRPPTPKSPITVDEWVAALPHPSSSSPPPTVQQVNFPEIYQEEWSSIEDEGDVWAGCEQGLEDQGEDLLSLGDEAGFMAGSSSLCPASSSTTVGRNKTIDSRESPIDSHVSGAQNLESLTSAGAGNSSYVPDILGPLVLPQQQQHYREQVLSPTHKNRPVTLTDGKNVIQRQLSPKGGLENRRSQFASLKDKQTSFQSDLSGLSLQSRSSLGSQSQEGISRIPERFLKPLLQRQASPVGGVDSRRSQFASLRDKQTSFQSDLSGLSLQSRSSIDSLLEARQADPVDVLLNLGFGSQSQEGIARIPERFMKPSQVPGNNIDELIKSEDNFSDMMDSTEWMSGLDPQGVPISRSALAARRYHRRFRRHRLRPSSPQPSIRSAPASYPTLRRSSVATVSPFISQLIESRRENRLRFMQKKNDLPSAPSPKPLTGASRFASVAKQLGMKSTVMNTFAATTNKLTVLNPENRRLLDLQGQKSPEVPRKRLIIGQSSFDLGRDGELLDVAGSVKEVVSESADSVTEEEKVDDYSSDGDDDDDLDDYRCSRHLSLRHKESVWSMASSATSVDSSEEELRDQRRRLQLILNRRPTPPETPGTPSSQGDPVDSPTFACSVTENERRRKLMRRLSLSKRVSTVSSGGSWELDEKIPEEDSEDVSNLQEQVIKESDAFISAISSSNCDILAQCSKAFCDNSDIPTVFNTNLTARTFTNDKALQTQPLQNIPNHSELGARLDTQRCHHSLPMAFVEPSSNLLMGKGERSYAEDEGKSRSQHRACSSLKRQECIDDVYSDNYPLSYRSTVMQQPSKLHMPHHIMKDLGKCLMHEVSHEENQRSCSLEPLHRSSSAQSDSSGFMEGDQGEGDSRTVISSQLSCGPFQSPGHAWWWSRESEGSVETVRYMPPGKPYPLHPGQNFYTHSSSAFDQPPSRLLNKCTCCIYSSQICRLHNTSAESHRFARPIPGTDLKTNTSGTDSFAYSPPTDRCNPLCPDLSSDCPLALESFNVNNSHISSPCFSHSAVIPVTCITQSTFNIPSTSVSSIEKSYCCQQHLRKSSGTCHRRRHRSLPEPLVDSSSSAVADLEGKRNSQSFHLLWQPYFQPSSRTTRPGLTTGYLSPSSCQYSSPSLTPLQPVQSHLPYQSYSFANSSGLSSNQLPLKGNNISRKKENSVNDRHSDHAYMEQSTPEILLSALQSYRVQLVQQEHLSHSLHKAASYFTDNTSHQFAQELRSISAIRAAIRAEVTHMEEIIFNSKPRVLNSTCVNKVMLQMLVLMQKQAELCHVIERLTITSPVSSPKSEPLTSKDFPITGQDSSKQLADAGCTNEKMKHTSYPGGSTSHNVALVTGSVNYSLDSRLTEANHDQQNRNSQASKLSQNDHGQSHMWLRNQSCKEANSSSSDIYLCSNADNSLLNSGNILRKEDISNNNSSDSCVHPSQEQNEPQSIPSSSPTTSNDIEWIMNTVKYQVQSQTQVVEAQLIHQSKEMEDMKKMLHLILNKLQ